MKETVAELFFQARQETNADSGCIAVPIPGRDRHEVLLSTRDTSVIEDAKDLEQALLTGEAEGGTLGAAGALRSAPAVPALRRKSLSFRPPSQIAPHFDWYTRCA